MNPETCGVNTAVNDPYYHPQRRVPDLKVFVCGNTAKLGGAWEVIFEPETRLRPSNPMRGVARFL